MTRQIHRSRVQKLRDTDNMKITKAHLKEIIKDELSKLDEIPTWRKIKHQRDGTPHPGLHPGPRKGEAEEEEEEAIELSTPRIDPTSTSPKSRRFRAKGQRK